MEGTSAATKRGAAATKRRSKRDPSEQPSSTCAALVSGTGTDENAKPHAVSTIETTSGPIVNAVGAPRRCAMKEDATAIAKSKARPGASKGTVTGRYSSVDENPINVIEIGITV